MSNNKKNGSVYDKNAVSPIWLIFYKTWLNEPFYLARFVKFTFFTLKFLK